jgi:DNA-binding transcriptional LysR family regulator
LTELDQWPLVAYGVEDPYRRRLDTMLDTKGIQRRVVAEASTASSLCALVREGLGIAIVNSLSANQMLALGLRSIRLSPTVGYEVGMVRPNLRAITPLTDEFADALRSCVRRRFAH